LDIGIAHTLWQRSEELIKTSLQSAA